MKWIVLEKNSQPDNYIAVMVAEEERILRAESKPCAVFKSSDQNNDKNIIDTQRLCDRVYFDDRVVSSRIFPSILK
jgi:hypothetical protein